MISINIFNILFKLYCDTFYSTVLRTVRMSWDSFLTLLSEKVLGFTWTRFAVKRSSCVPLVEHSPSSEKTLFIVFYKGNKVTAHLYLVESRSKLPFLLFVSRGFSSTVPNVKLSIPFCNSPFWKQVERSP